MKTSTLKLHSLFIPVAAIMDCDTDKFVRWMTDLAKLHGIAGLYPESITDRGSRYMPASLDLLIAIQSARIESALVSESGRMN